MRERTNMVATTEPVDQERQAFLLEEQHKWVTVEEAAQILRTSLATLFGAIRQDQIALFAQGKVWRIHVDSLKECQKRLSDWKK